MTKAWSTFLALPLLAVFACSPSGELGQRCESESDCSGGLQCFAGFCQAACSRHVECGHGFQCNAARCEAATLAAGDICHGEYACAAGLSCRAVGEVSRCQPLVTEKAPVGTSCRVDEDCARGGCHLGTCSFVCNSDAHCPAADRCQSFEAPVDGACFPATGQRSISLTPDAEGNFQIDLPSGVTSVAIMADTPTAHLRLSDLRRGTTSVATERLGKTQLVQLAPDVQQAVMSKGHYDGRVMRSHDGETWSVWPPPRLRALVRFGGANRLMLHLSVGDLTAHPCLANQVDPANPLANAEVSRFWNRLTQIMDGAGVNIVLAGSSALRKPWHLGAVEHDRLGILFAHSGAGFGTVPVVLARSLLPAGVQVTSMTQPGAPAGYGPANGIAVSMDTLCYRRPEWLARQTAHQLARYLGLPYNVDPQQNPDSIADTSDSPSNLLFFSEHGGTEVTQTQAAILATYPGLMP